MYTEGSPKAVSASDMISRRSRSSVSPDSTTRMPRPPPPAAALIKQRVADLAGHRECLFVLGDRAQRTGHRWDAGCAGNFLGLDLVAHAADDVRRRTDETDSLLLAQCREIGVLGQETVTGVNRIDLERQGGTDDCLRHPGSS